MMKQFDELKVYAIGGGVAFEEVGASVPFLVVPKGQATIKPWGASGFLFENIVTGDVIAFVAEYDDVLDSAGAAYGVSQVAVFTALGAFFFDLDLDAQNLASVLGYGNFSGPYDIDFDAGQGLIFDNGSQLKEGTTNGGLGGNKGIAQFCSIGYELKWEAGRLYVMEQNGFTIRWVLFQFNNTPTVTDDSSLGYVVGSRWTLDNGDVYECTDATLGAAVWVLSSGSVPTLAQVLASGNSAGANDIDMNGKDLLNVNEITSTGDLTLNPVGSIDANGKTLNMTGGEIHNVPLIHSQNNTDLTIEGKGTGDVILKTANINKLTITDSTGITFGTYADLNGQDIKNINIASGKNNANLNIEALGTGDIVFKTNNIDWLKITDTGVFTGLPEAIQLAASDETTALTTGTAKVTFRMPFAMTLTGVRASLTTAQTSGSIFTVDINQGGTSVLGTKLTIDNTEKTSVTAATPATITTSALTDDAEITIDIDQIGDGTAKGLKITLIGTR